MRNFLLIFFSFPGLILAQSLYDPQQLYDSPGGLFDEDSIRDIHLNFYNPNYHNYLVTSWYYTPDERIPATLSLNGIIYDSVGVRYKGNSTFCLPNDNNNWYLNVGQGMGMTLLIANEKKAYTLSDRSSWISFSKRDNLKVVCENDPPLFNQYGIILVSNKLNNKLNVEDAKTYINWLISNEAKKIINSFKKKGEQLFFYNHH